MSENLSDLIKNPVILGVAGVACIVIVALIIRSSTSHTSQTHDIAKVDSEKNVNTEKNEIKETFIFDRKDEEIIEYFPASEMNVMYSDANGNLATTRDLGLSNLTVTGASQLQGVVIGNVSLSEPNDQTRVTKDGIILGGSNNGKEGNSAQISVGRHEADSLCIVGMSDANKVNRKITLWAEGGLKLYGNMYTNGEIKTDSNLAIGPSRKFLLQPGTDDWLRLRTADGAYGSLGLAATNLWAQNFYGNPRFRDSGITVDGLITSNGGYSMLDNRTVKPNQLVGHRVQFGFGSMTNNGSAPFADYMHFNGWGDVSGQNPNLVMFNKGSIGMRIYQGAFNADTAYSQYMDAVMADSSGNVNSGSVRATLSDGLCQFRAKHGNRGTMFRQDGDDFYILTTASGSPDAGWNNLRPFYINNASGNVTMGHNVGVGGAASVTGALSAGSISTGGALSAGSISTGGVLSAGGNIVTNRGRISFMNATDLNHTIYNNYTNTDGEGIWDGMKMHTYKGLDIRTGDANSTSKKTMVEVRDGSVSIAGELKAKTFWVRKNNYLYYPEDAIIYQSMFNALDVGAISKSGNPVGWNDSRHRTDPWEGRLMLHIGRKNTFPHGLRVNVPAGKNVIWTRCINVHWVCLQVHKLDGTSLGNFMTGLRNSHDYSPDGGTNDSAHNKHAWMAIPVPGEGSYVLTSGNSLNDGGNDSWISGIAFSTNPWNHAYNSALSYHWNVNGGTAVAHHSDNWKGDQLFLIKNGDEVSLVVPIVSSGNDKLFYIAEHNNDWSGSMHHGIKVDDVPIERLRTTWDHPLARSFNSKLHYRFLAARIPANLTTGKTFVTIKIDMTSAGNMIHFREAGTIDMY